MSQTTRLLYNIRFRNSKEKEHTKGREIIRRWCSTLDEIRSTARGILAGLCTVGGYKHGHADIYEVDELKEKLVDSISW